jgi:integrase
MATRADNKEGSCKEVTTERHKGKWRVQYSVEYASGKKKRLSRLFATKTEGKQFLRSLKRNAPTEEETTRPQMTLGDWNDWLVETDWEETLAERTIRGRRQRFDDYIRPTFGEIRLSKIDPLRVKTAYKVLLSDGVGKATLVEIRSDLVRVFNQSVSPYQQVPMTVANPFRLTVPRPTPRDAVALTPKEICKAIESKKLDVHRRAMLAVFLLGGVRLGEQMALTRKQLRFDENLIVIDQAVRISHGGRQTIGLPKKDKTRNAVMCLKLKAILWDYAKDMDPEQFLWSALSENKPRMKKLVYATWRTILKDSKLPSAMSPQDCRLTHINIIEKLMPEVSTTTFKEHVGHMAVGVTEANYTRPLSTAQKILQGSLNRVFK